MAEDPEVANLLGLLGNTFFRLGRFEEAQRVEARALEIVQAQDGDHPDLLLRLENLAATYRRMGRDEDAVPLEARALEIVQAQDGDAS